MYVFKKQPSLLIMRLGVRCKSFLMNGHAIGSIIDLTIELLFTVISLAYGLHFLTIT